MMPAASGNGPLHIEVVSDTFPGDINGVAMTLGTLCGELRRRGHRVEVLRPGKPQGPHETGLPWWPLPGYWEIKVGAPWPGWLRRRWKRERPDAVYIAIESPLGYAALRAAGVLGIPAIGGFHTRFHDYLETYGFRRFAKRVLTYQRWFHNRLYASLAPSPQIVADLTAAGFRKVRLLGRGVDTRHFQPSRRSPQLRAEWGAAPEAPVVLVTGRVSTEKNIGLALRAFAALRAIEPQAVCIVVGDGPARATLQREHPEVRFTGYRTGDALAECYASADILLFPSVTETFGNVLLEGMASGLAALAFDHAAAAWHGIDGQNCLKVPQGDEAAFLRSATRLADPALRAILGCGARSTAETLGWDRIGNQLEEILLAAARGTRGNQGPRTDAP
jgi:glycosyltransferase involved in cell wall biosynthesis